MAESLYAIRLAPPAQRAITDTLPEAVAAAALEFIYGALRSEPWRVGKPLQAPLAGRHAARRGTYRLIYRIDDDKQVVTVLFIRHRADAYR